MGNETQKFSQELASEIASGQGLSKEVTFLKSELVKLQKRFSPRKWLLLLSKRGICLVEHDIIEASQRGLKKEQVWTYLNYASESGGVSEIRGKEAMMAMSEESVGGGKWLGKDEVIDDIWFNKTREKGIDKGEKTDTLHLEGTDEELATIIGHESFSLSKLLAALVITEYDEVQRRSIQDFKYYSYNKLSEYWWIIDSFIALFRVVPSPPVGGGLHTRPI
ncbi:hypothetical protein Tco_0950068 [Tanacetum coccineum]